MRLADQFWVLPVSIRKAKRYVIKTIDRLPMTSEITTCQESIRGPAFNKSWTISERA